MGFTMGEAGFERIQVMTAFYDIIQGPLVTEKSVSTQEALGRYSFAVSLKSTKPVIRQAIESHFKVKVLDVRTLIVHGKVRRAGRYQGRKPNWKKAIVTLAKGQKLDIFEAK